METERRNWKRSLTGAQMLAFVREQDDLDEREDSLLRLAEIEDSLRKVKAAGFDFPGYLGEED